LRKEGESGGEGRKRGVWGREVRGEGEGHWEK